MSDSPGTEKLHEYWVHGEGAAKIAWGSPGDFDRCVSHLGKYVADPQGYCAKAHHDALGIWPATHAAMEHKSREAQVASTDQMDLHPSWDDASPGLPDLSGLSMADYDTAHAAHGEQCMAMDSEGGRSHIGFSALSSQLAGKGASDPKALAAWIGRKKYGRKGFAALAAKARAGKGGRSAERGPEERTVPFDIESAQPQGDGLTFEGYAAVYGQRTRISDAYEDFDEQIAPGAFRSITGGKYPVLMFEHGRHPLIGTLPLGRITDARDDSQGLWIEGRLTDNWLIQPVRDAIADKAITGMSFRFSVNGEDGQTWERSGDTDLRTLRSLDVPELGPVVFPAYEPTTAGVRSALDKLPVIGRPSAGARAASGRDGGVARQRTAPELLQARFRGDGEALALRGIPGVRI